MGREPLERLDHVALVVRSVDEAVEWYAARFSFRVAYRDPTWALLEFANVRLALMAPGKHPPHVAFVREDGTAFGEVKPHRDGTRSAYIEDPSGNAVEIVEDSTLE
jgi:catechol 2,3-dioxygenase-like lactoylglutathione lyase family enzyme